MFKLDQEAYHKGRRAYFNREDIRDNPYDEEDEPQKEWSWERGFNTAYQEDNEYGYPV